MGKELVLRRFAPHNIPGIGAKYVREQEKHDQMMDRITTKEAEDPFRG